jgi:hypothetical protein
MALPQIILRVVLNEGRFIADTSRPDNAPEIQPLTFGDKVAFKIEAYKRAQSDASVFQSVDISSFTTALIVGESNQRPSIGFYTISGISGAFPALATAADVEAATPDYTFEGEPGDLIMVASSNGAQSAPTVTYAGSLTVAATVTQITPGTTTTPASWRIELLQSAPAVCSSWSAGSTSPASAITNPASKIFWLQLDPNARGGFYSLVCGGFTTGLISLFASAYDVQNALQASGAPGNGASVQTHPDGGFLISVQSSGTTLTVSDATLNIPRNITGQLDLSGVGVRALLDGAQFVGTALALRIADASTNVITEANAPIILQMPIVRAS